MKRLWMLFCGALLFVPVWAQDSGCLLPSRLAVGDTGQVLMTDGQPLNVRDSAGVNGTRVGSILENQAFSVLQGATCSDGISWWQVQAGDVTGWIAEGSDGVYFVSPANYLASLDWPVMLEPSYDVPDPTLITLPQTYAGDMPSLPVDLNDVSFVDKTGLNESQLAQLAQNGFVVVPGTDERFTDVYRATDTWGYADVSFDEAVDENGILINPGQPNFVTTDVMLNALYDVFNQVLMELERAELYPTMQSVVIPMTQEAAAQYQDALGTPLEEPARNTLIYMTTALQLMDLSEEAESDALIAVDPTIVAQAQDLTDRIVAAEGQLPISFLEDYSEDFGAYRVRGHYEGDPSLESYFRTMNWLGRITFRANSADETLTALLLIRALRASAYDDWFSVHDTISFIVGPVDDLSPLDYLPLAQDVFGQDLSLDALSDPAKLQTFRERLAALPGPRVNGLVLAADTPAGDVEELTSGFRLMGQRFTFDAYVLGRLFTPYVEQRILPAALDVPAVFGSELALSLSDGTDYPQYQPLLTSLQAEVADVTEDEWHETFYGGWLQVLEPLWNRKNPAAYPPLMNTDAWMRRDLQTGLASYTQLKHATVLYAKQPTGFGGGGSPLLIYGYVEPNPLVFARISILSEQLYLMLSERKFIPNANEDEITPENESMLMLGFEMRNLARLSASFAEIARKELTGEALTDEEFFLIRESFANYLQSMEANIYGTDNPLPPVAMVTDIANNTTFSKVRQIGVGAVDYIYVVVPGPRGYQVARGGVFSYYEFEGESSNRLTDSAWREAVTGNALPARPDWVNVFFEG